MKKNRFLVFLFALIPGAGYMYQGMMKKGTAIMAILFFTIACSNAFYFMQPLLFFLPVIWFYSFFDTFHMSALTHDERLSRDVLFWQSLLHTKDTLFLKEKRKILAWILIFFGVWSFLAGVSNFFYITDVYSFIFLLIEMLPSVLVCVVLVGTGIYLLYYHNRAADDTTPFREGNARRSASEAYVEKEHPDAEEKS